jgi:uncharacterized membrane protein
VLLKDLCARAPRLDNGELIFLRSQPVRLCSAGVVLITVGKVFLLDMAGLTGVWRAFSFIGLGLVLVGIGYLYQRLLFRKPAETEVAA